MGTVIKSAAFSYPSATKGILEMMAGVAEQCMRTACSSIEEVEMLINTVVYNEKHISEPALAALIQDTLENGSCDAGTKTLTGRKLFSFDLNNGGGGVLTAFRVMDGFIRSGTVKKGVITAGDARPATGETVNYPYADSAGAVFLSDDPSHKGFVSFRNDTWPDYAMDFQSFLSWNSGHLKLDIVQRDDYALHCVACAEKSLRKFLADENLSPTDINLVLASPSPVQFSAGLQKSMNWKDNMVETDRSPEFYSSGICLPLSSTIVNGLFRNARHILFITAGAGITISMALYQNG